VRLVLSGHVHRSYAQYARSEIGSLLVVQAATATSVRLRGERNAYNRVVVDAGGTINIVLRAWNGSSWQTRSETG
jgi:hypothetical protein